MMKWPYVHRSMDCVRVKDHDEAKAHGAGAFYWDAGCEAIYIMIPGSDRPIRFGISKPLANGAQWHWDGNYEKPTLTPELHLIGLWHGSLTEGRLIAVEPYSALD